MFPCESSVIFIFYTPCQHLDKGFFDGLRATLKVALSFLCDSPAHGVDDYRINIQASRRQLRERATFHGSAL